MNGSATRRSAAGLALLALAGLGAGPPQFVAGDARGGGLTPAHLTALQAYTSPVVSARSAAVIDADSGAVLFSKNGDQRFAPASLTKMMTALLAVERGRLDQRITATDRVRDVEPVMIGLDPGESLSVEELLYGLLLWSGNDAAVAIAEGLAGSTGRFADWMNEKAVSLELRGTHFANPHGLDAPGHYSTAADLARLTAAMMREPALAKIAGSRTYTIPGPPLYYFRSSNPLLGVYQGVTGGKTGLTDDCGRCFAVSAERGSRAVVAVVLGSQDIARDGRILLDFAFTNYEWVPVAAGSRGAFATLRGAERGESRLKSDAALPVARWEPTRVRTRTVMEPEGLAPGAASGHLLVETALRALGTLPLYAAGAAR